MAVDIIDEADASCLTNNFYIGGYQIDLVGLSWRYMGQALKLAASSSIFDPLTVELFVSFAFVDPFK